MVSLSSNLTDVKGVGEKTLESFHQANLRSVRDLLYFLPRKHEDYSRLTTIRDISPGKVTIKARADSIVSRQVRRGLKVTTATLSDNTGKLQAVWFNQPYRVKQLSAKDEFFFSGEFELNMGRYQLTNPSAELVKDMPTQTDRLLPVYRAVKGLKSQLVRKILDELRPFISLLPETLPRDLVARYQLVSRSDALMFIHFPKQPIDIAKAKERLGFEELFQLLLASKLNKAANSRIDGYKIPFDQPIVKAFVQQLPFELTGAQRRAAWDILQDFERATPMNRLLQGDVGSGKTIVAGITARQAASRGYQTALMAPTEILASQHAETLSRLLSSFGVTVGLLIGSVKGNARKILYEQIKKGEVDVIVGTHALIQETVDFRNLGFVVIDEQHRFGVDQRQTLLKKSARMPHLLAMTATPIPRSLALTVYGELDISILNELPKNRLPIKTNIISPASRAQAYRAVDAELKKGRQAYIICALIDDNPENDKKSAETEAKRLKSSVFQHRRIGLLHGKMKAAEKEAVMRDFKDSVYDILVSTTVVEVGVDVPNASVMLIENADHFGLSQLHQLRGRVGRGAHQSHCYLMMSDSSKPSQRIREIARSNDGFYLAEVDLKLRGPGEIYGRAQHGALNLQVASLADAKLVARAQRAADEFVERGYDLLQYKELKADVEYYQRLTTLN